MKNIIISLCFLFFTNLAFASGDSINYSKIDHWETAVYSYDVWQYRLGFAPEPADWNQLDFDASSWFEGMGGIGYGDDDDVTVISPTQSLFMRHKFSVTDISKIEGAFFHADYDDAFVAYLNGVEIARSNNISGIPPRYDEWATSLREATLVNGGTPEKYILGICELKALLTDGENVLAVQTHNFEGAVSSDMSSIFFLSFGINDGSRDYGSTPPWFSAPSSFSSHLPIVKIYSDQAIVDEPKVSGRMEIIWNGVGALSYSAEPGNEYNGKIGVELRGQSSLFFFPKKGLGFETRDENDEDLDVSILGFPEEEDWVLHGPYSDKTLMRNVLAMHLARGMGQYASRTRFVELTINEDYQGVYVLMEKIKRDVGRVDIANLKEEDIEGEELTGGYVFKIDKGIYDWSSKFAPVNNPNERIRFQFVSPNREKIQPEQAAYIESYVDSFERAINFPQVAQVKHYREFIDFTSFAEHFLHAEFTKNVDAYRISSYFHKKKITDGGKIHAGPVWDFNLSLGNSEYCDVANPVGWMYDEHCGITNPIWYQKLFEDEEFRNILKCRWLDLRQGVFHQDSILKFIDDQVDALGTAVDRNFEKWPILNQHIWPNAMVTGSYMGEIDFMKSNIIARLNWMDDNVIGECLPTGINDFSEEFGLTVFPNPTSGILNISLFDKNQAIESVEISNATGKRIAFFKNNFEQIDLTQKPSGIYFLKVNLVDRKAIFKRVVVE